MFTAQVDLPTPPLPAPTEIMFLTPSTCCFCGTPPVRETCASHLISAFGEPGSTASAASMSSWILFFSGQAGVVRTTRMAIVCGSTTATSWLILSSIIGRCMSRYCPVSRACKTVCSESWATAIRTSLPRGPDVTEDDVVDQAFHRREGVGEDDAVGGHRADVSGLKRLGADRHGLGVRLRPGAGAELINRGWARGRVDDTVSKSTVGITPEDVREDGVQSAAEGIHQPVVCRRPPDVDRQHAVRRQVRLGALEELARREIERDVRLAIRIHQDDVAAPGLGRHPVAAVGHGHVKIRLRHGEVAPPDVDELRDALYTL